MSTLGVKKDSDLSSHSSDDESEAEYELRLRSLQHEFAKQLQLYQTGETQKKAVSMQFTSQQLLNALISNANPKACHAERHKKSNKKK